MRSNVALRRSLFFFGKTYARSLSNVQKSKSLSHRDVFVEDSSFTDESWQRLSSNIKELKHPSSQHAIGDYAKFLHNSSTYHFNNLGEFSTNFTAIQDFNASTSTIVDEVNNLSKRTHKLIVWPDRFVLSGLMSADIPQIVPLLMRDEMIEFDKLKTLLPGLHISNIFPPIIVMCSVSKLMSYKMAHACLSEFEGELMNSKLNRNFKLFFAGDMGGHRNDTNVLILPSEDSFEYVGNRARIASIIAKQLGT